MGRKSKVENEPGALRVLLCLVDDKKTPKEIAQILNLSPPTVVFHLNRLRQKGFVKRLEKQGKEQPYQINWQKIYEFFLETVLPQFALAKELPEFEKKQPDTEQIEKLRNYEKYRDLINDPCFQEIPREGLKTLNLRMKNSVKIINFGLEEYFKAFGEALTQVRPDEIILKGNPLFNEFMKKLNETRRFNYESFRWIQVLANLGLIKPIP